MIDETENLLLEPGEDPRDVLVLSLELRPGTFDARCTVGDPVLQQQRRIGYKIGYLARGGSFQRLALAVHKHLHEYEKGGDARQAELALVRIREAFDRLGDEWSAAMSDEGKGDA